MIIWPQVLTLLLLLDELQKCGISGHDTFGPLEIEMPISTGCCSMFLSQPHKLLQAHEICPLIFALACHRMLNQVLKLTFQSILRSGFR